MSAETDYCRQWREADRMAQEFERRVVTVEVNALHGNDGPPSRAELDEIERLHDVARDLFKQCMRQTLAMNRRLTEIRRIKP